MCSTPSTSGVERQALCRIRPSLAHHSPSLICYPTLAISPPGENVVYQCETNDEEVCGFVDSTYNHCQCNLCGLVVNLTAWDYNGQAWSKHSTQQLITLYQCDRDFIDLSAIRPLRFTKNPAGAEKAFLERGEKFCWLSWRNKYTRSTRGQYLG